MSSRRNDVFHRAAHFAGHQLVLGLAAELGLGHLHAQHAAQAFAHVVAGDLDLGLLGELVFFDVLVDDARHRGAQAGQVGAAVALRDVVGEAEHLFVVAAVPLHGHFHADVGALVAGAVAHGVEHVGVQRGLALVDEVHKALDAAGAGKVVFLAGALVFQADAHAVVQEREFAQALGQDFVVEIVVLFEDVGVGQEVHLGAALLGWPGNLHRRNLHAVFHFQDAVLHEAARKINLVHLAFAAHREAQPDRERVHAAHAHAVQAARDLVAVLVELAAGVQLGQRDLGRRALGLVLVVHLHAGGDAAAVVGDADRVVAVDGDDDVVAVAGQRFVDRVVDHLEHQVVQAGAVGRVADVHARAFAHRLQAFQDLDRALAVALARAGLVAVDRGLEIGALAARFAGVDGFGGLVFVGHKRLFWFARNAKPAGERVGFWEQETAVGQIRMGMTTYLNALSSGLVTSAELLPSDSSTRTISWLMFCSASIR